MTKFEVKQFSELTTKELFEIYKLRVAVFCGGTKMLLPRS